MNIAIFTQWGETGAGYVSRAYMDVLKKQGCEVFIYAFTLNRKPTNNPDWDLPNVTYPKRYATFSLNRKINTAFIDILEFTDWLRSNNINTVIFNEWFDKSLVLRLKRMGYLTGAYIDYYKESTVKQFEIYDFLLCNTKRHYSVFENSNIALYIPWGTNIDLFKPAEDYLTIVKKEVVFFHSAGIRALKKPRKGTDLLVKAFVNVSGSARLIIHSAAHDLSLFGEDFLQLLRSDGRIEVINRIVTAPGLYHLGDVYVYPARLDGIGLSLPEALSCGLPAITTDCAPMNEFVKHETNGLLVKVANTHKRADNYYWPETIVDIDDLTRQMQRYVDDRELLYKHKYNARKLAEQELNWETNTKGLAKIIQERLDRTGRMTKSLSYTERVFFGISNIFAQIQTGLIFKIAEKIDPNRRGSFAESSEGNK